jgi:hypothetical protein
MRTARGRRVGLVIAAVVATCGITTGTAASFTAQQASCSGFTGPAWSIPELGKQGTHWKVTAHRVKCDFATRWAKKLLQTKYVGEAATKLKGPKGWKCLPSIPRGGGVPGECRNGKRFFAWGIDAKL